MFWKLGKRVLKEKGRVVDQKNHNELRGFSAAPLSLVSISLKRRNTILEGTELLVIKYGVI